MGIWIDILTLGATGQALAARQQLVLDLPLALRRFVLHPREVKSIWASCPGL